MMTTILETENPNYTFNYYENDMVVSKNLNDFYHFISPSICQIFQNNSDFDKENNIFINYINNFNKEDVYNNVIDLRSNDKKALLFLTSGPYHLMVDFLARIIELYEKDKNIIFYLNSSYFEWTANVSRLYFDKSFETFLKKFFEYYKIKYVFLNDFSKIDHVVINNFFIINQTQNKGFSKKISEYLSPFLQTIGTIPNKKVYLSRRAHQDMPIYQNTISIKQDIRIYNENILEDYLTKNFNFEVLVAEEFKTFEEQINYFYQTKTLMSSTNAGLTNLLHMQDQTLVIELVCPLLIQMSGNVLNFEKAQTFFTSCLNTLWQPLAALKNINYLSIPNLTQDAQDIINKINKTKYLKELMEC